VRNVTEMDTLLWHLLLMLGEFVLNRAMPFSKLIVSAK
jgi:hypothetical protein